MYVRWLTLKIISVTRIKSFTPMKNAPKEVVTTIIIEKPATINKNVYFSKIFVELFNYWFDSSCEHKRLILGI